MEDKIDQKGNIEIVKYVIRISFIGLDNQETGVYLKEEPYGNSEEVPFKPYVILKDDATQYYSKDEAEGEISKITENPYVTMMMKFGKVNFNAVPVKF